MRELIRFQNVGQRASNLDRILVGRNFAYLLDGYGCSEQSLDSVLDSVISPLGHIDGAGINHADVKFCFSGFTFDDESVNVHYSGDCRIYMEGIGIVSEDKTLAWNLISNKKYSVEETSQLVRKHPSRNIITKYISKKKNFYSSSYFHRPVGNLMLCSDGFWSEFSEYDLGRFLVDPLSIQKALQEASFSDNAACIIFGFR